METPTSGKLRVERCAKLFSAKNPCRPAAHARGESAIAPSWIDELIA